MPLISQAFKILPDTEVMMGKHEMWREQRHRDRKAKVLIQLPSPPHTTIYAPLKRHLDHF